MKSKIIMSILVIVVAVSLIAGATFAWFTASASSNSNNFSSGTLNISVDTNKTAEGQHEFSVGGLLQPGDTVTKGADGSNFVTFEIVNKGSLNLAYIDNFVLGGDTTLADVIYIKNWKNSAYNSTGVQVWEEPLIVNNVTKYPAHAALDLNHDGKVSLAEWLNYDNFQMGMHYGWDCGGLKPSVKFVNQFELVFDENATNIPGADYSGRTMTIAYKAIATQVNETAITKMLTDNGLSSAPGNVLGIANDRIAEQ